MHYYHAGKVFVNSPGLSVSQETEIAIDLFTWWHEQWRQSEHRRRRRWRRKFREQVEGAVRRMRTGVLQATGECMAIDFSFGSRLYIVFVFEFECVWMSGWICLALCLSACLPACRSVRLSLCACMYARVNMPTCIFCVYYMWPYVC